MWAIEICLAVIVLMLGVLSVQVHSINTKTGFLHGVAKVALALLFVVCLAVASVTAIDGLYRAFGAMGGDALIYP